MSRITVSAFALALAPQALAAPALVTFDADVRVTADAVRGSVTIEGAMLDASCLVSRDRESDAISRVSDSPIDPAIIPCDEGAAYVLVMEGRNLWGFAGEVAGVSDGSITLLGSEASPLIVVGDEGTILSSVVSTDLYGIWGTDGTRGDPDLVAIWGTDGAAIWGTNGTSYVGDATTGIWGTNGTSYERGSHAGIWGTDGTAEGIWGTDGTLVAIWGTDGTAIWGTNGTSIAPDLLGISGTGLLGQVGDGSEAFERYGDASLRELVADGIAVPLTTVSTALLPARIMHMKEVCSAFRCD